MSERVWFVPWKSAKKKAFPVADRSADRSAVLIVVKRRLRLVRVGEVIPGIERALVAEHEHGALRIVGSRLDRHVDDGAAAAAELRRVVRRLRLELRDGVEVGLEDRVSGAVVVVVVHAIEQVVRRGGSHSVDDERVLLSRVPVAPAAHLKSAGRESGERNETAPAHGQLLDLLGLDDLAEGSLLCLQDRRLGGDDHGLGRTSDFEGEVDPEPVLDPHVDVLPSGRSETLKGHEHVVGSDRQTDRFVIATAVGGRPGDDARLLMGQRHRGTREDPAARVPHRAQNSPGVDLRQRRDRHETEQNEPDRKTSRVLHVLSFGPTALERPGGKERASQNSLRKAVPLTLARDPPSPRTCK